MAYVIVGYDGNGGNRDQYINSSSWAALLTMAGLYGWKPEGTKLSVWTHKQNGEKHYGFRSDEYAEDEGVWSYQEDWCGTYCSNDGQDISATDAKNLSMALEGFLHDSLCSEQRFEQEIAGLDTDIRKDVREIITASSEPRGLEVLTNMIAVLRMGECRIL